jgi:hypothetical protein
MVSFFFEIVVLLRIDHRLSIKSIPFFHSSIIIEIRQARASKKSPDNVGDLLELRGFVDKINRSDPRAEIPIERAALIAAHDHCNGRVLSPYIAQQIETVSIRQINIQQNGIDLAVFEYLNCPSVGTGGYNKIKTWKPFQHSSQTAHDKRGVIYN